MRVVLPRAVASAITDLPRREYEISQLEERTFLAHGRLDPRSCLTEASNPEIKARIADADIEQQMNSPLVPSRSSRPPFAATPKS